jgi:hypothetical protein
MVACTCNPSYGKDIDRKTTVPGHPRKEHETLSEKQPKSKKKGGGTGSERGTVQVAECMSSKHKTLSSNPSTAKNKYITI